jgi:hypothetical protein
LDERRLNALGASVLDVTAPSQPVQTVIGLGDTIQVHVPVEARVLFGSAGVVAQAELAWKENTPLLTARVAGDFRGVQTGALGLNSTGLHTPLVEDSLDGSFTAAIDEAPLRRWTSFPYEVLDRLDLSFDVARSKGQTIPGVVQAGVDGRLQRLNEILGRVTDAIRLYVPPQITTYKGLKASFEARKGIVRTKEPLLELTGVKLLSTKLLNVDAGVRIRLGARDQVEMPLSHLFHAAQGGAR